MTNILEDKNLLNNDSGIPAEDSVIINENNFTENSLIESESAENNLSLKEQRIIYLYRVTNLINNKIYIGQSVDPKSRWRGHVRDSLNPKNPFQKAINKYGADNFCFEVIACCKGQDNANDIETQLVVQYDSFVKNGKGYNATHGGFNAPKSDAWKEAMRKKHSLRTPEEKESIRKKISEATINQIKVKGHPASGHKWTEEQRQAISEWRSSVDKDSIYTPEVRQKMRESHLGQKPSEETLEKRSKSLREAWKKKNEIRCAEQDIRCHAEGCTISGSNVKYAIVDGIRYCSKHGSRMKRNGHINLLPKVVIEMTPEIRQKISQSRKGKCLGRVPHNKVHLTAEQIELILTDSRSTMQLSRDMGIGKKVISTIRSRNKR